VPRRLLIAVALLSALLAVPATAGAGPRKVPQRFFGAMWDRELSEARDSLQKQGWTSMARNGVESARVVFSWYLAQPNPGETTYRRTDPAVRHAAEHGIDLLPVVTYAPDWARVLPMSLSSAPSNFPAYVAYLELLIARYGPQGQFWKENPGVPYRPIRKWQIWNEPHIRGYWDWPGDQNAWVRSYAALLRESAVAIRRADPGAKVVIAGLADYVWRHLKALYGAGIKGSYDILALNMYTVRPVDVLRGVRLARRSLRRAHDEPKPVWLTETTWPAARGRLPTPATAWQRAWWTTDRGMATRLQRFYRLAIQERRRIQLERVFWYTWASGYDERDLFDYTGLVRASGGAFSATPALRAYARSALRHEGCRKTTAGRCR
jgi:hypothetical protein